MKYLTILLVTFLSFSSLANYPVSDIPKELLIDADIVVRSYNHYVNVISKNRGEEIIEKTITFFDYHDEQSLIINFNDDEEIDDFTATIYDKNGKKIKRFRNSDLYERYYSKNNLYTSAKIKYIDFEYNTFPYTVKYKYKKQLKNASIAFLSGIYFQSATNESIEKFNYKITVPDFLEINFKSQAWDVKPNIYLNEGKRTYKWEASNLKALTFQDFCPSPYALIPHVELTLSEFKFDEFYGSNESWSSYGSFFTELYKGRQECSPEIKKIVLDLTKDLKTDTEKITVLYKYLQDNYRYVSIQLGIGGWQPFMASEVGNQKYGDCKGLSNFMLAMLNVVNIKSNAALIYSNSNLRKPIDEAFPKNQFNHQILYIPSEDIWLDCTEDEAPVNYITYRNANRQALIIDGVNSYIKETPKLTENQNVRRSNSTISYDESYANITTKMTLEGRRAEKFKTAKDDNTNKLMIRVFNNSTFDISSLEMITEENQPIKYFEIMGQFTNKQRKSGQILNLVPFLNYINIPAKYENRVYGLELDYARSSIDTFTHLVTIDLEKITLPKNKSIETKFGNYSLEFIKKDNSIIVVRTLVHLEYYGTSEDYKDFRAFRINMRKHDKSVLYIAQEN